MKVVKGTIEISGHVYIESLELLRPVVKAERALIKLGEKIYKKSVIHDFEEIITAPVN